MAVAGIVFLSGPSAGTIELSGNIDTAELVNLDVDKHIASELQVHGLKPDNEAKVIWVDSNRQQTEHALVYLHGFSASRGEGDPMHEEFARRYQMNAYLARLEDHGVEEAEAMLDMTPEGLLQSAKEAIMIGRKLGKKVIVMSCSTGGTLGLFLAAHNPDLIDGLVCYSPNIDIYDQMSHLIDGPWGKQILQWVEGGNYHSWEATKEEQQYWTTSYRIEAIIGLRQLLDATMTPETFNKIRQPLLVLYYYKSEEEQDKVVSVEAMQDMYKQISTPNDQKRMISVPKVGHHVISSKYKSQDLETVRGLTFSFAEEVLGLVRKID